MLISCAFLLLKKGCFYGMIVSAVLIRVYPTLMTGNAVDALWKNNQEDKRQQVDQEYHTINNIGAAAG